jgi:hypothetical protein
MERQVTWPIESRRNKQQSPTPFPPLDPRSTSLLFVKTCRRCARLSLFFVQITTGLKFHSKLIHPQRDCTADTSSVHVVSGLSASVHLIIGVSDIRSVTYGPTCSSNKRKQSCTTCLSVCLPHNSTNSSYNRCCLLHGVTEHVRNSRITALSHSVQYCRQSEKKCIRTTPIVQIEYCYKFLKNSSLLTNNAHYINTHRL